MIDPKTLPPEIASPLGPFKGEKPPAPAWFDAAIAHEPERSVVQVAGAGIELLTWGERGKPGLLLVHGASAHADWWSFIAPQLADQWRVAAISMSGMGGSDWRERYSSELFAQEMDAAAHAAGLYEAAEKPIYIGHSFGGAAVYYAALAHPERMRATILIDTGFGGPPPQKDGAGNDVRPPQRTSPNRIYATLEEALARFRFLPPQRAGNLYVADFIARRSLKRAPLPDGGEGWTWRFDPFLFPKLDRSGIHDIQDREPGPTVHIFGERSNIIARTKDQTILSRNIKRIAIPDSDHHIMVDQPLALVAALRGVLSGWG